MACRRPAIPTSSPVCPAHFTRERPGALARTATPGRRAIHRAEREGQKRKHVCRRMPQESQEARDKTSDASIKSPACDARGPAGVVKGARSHEDEHAHTQHLQAQHSRLGVVPDIRSGQLEFPSQQELDVERRLCSRPPDAFTHAHPVVTSQLLDAKPSPLFVRELALLHQSLLQRRILEQILLCTLIGAFSPVETTCG